MAFTRMYFLPFVVFLYHIRSVFSAASCQSLVASTSERLLNPCVFVVDYPFFVPNGVSLDTLRKAASDSLNNTQLLSLTPNCQGALVRYACSLVYRKCNPGIVLTTPSTYNFAIYSNDTGLTTVPVPFQRPCVSVCTALSTICADPLYVLASGGFPNCYSKFNYANNPALPLPYRFDLKNDQTKCYAPRLIPLSGPSERYVRGATKPCQGIVDEFFVLPGNRLNSNYTVLQMPTAIQTVLNTGLASSFASFPRWLSPSCNMAIRQYFCYQYFFRPQGVSVRQALIEGVAGTAFQNSLPQIQAVADNLYPGLLNRAVYFPRYANRTVCQEYTDICSEFRYRAERPALEPDCYRSSGDTMLFPPGVNQTILSRRFPVTLGANQVVLTLKFETEPDYESYYNASEMNYNVVCPPKYSVNPDPADDEIDEIPGTGCAADCRTGFWTDDEWAEYDTFSIIVSAISLFFCVAVLIIITVTRDWKASYLVAFFTITSLISSLYHLSITAGMPWKERFCYSDVLRRRRSTGASNCMRHATFSSFLYLAGVMIILLMSLQRTLQMTGNRAVLSKPSYNIFQFLVALFPPVIAVALAWSQSFFGFGGATPWCSMDLMPSIYLMGFPVLVVSIMSYSVYFYGVIKTSKGASKVAIASYPASANAHVSGADKNYSSAMATGNTAGMTVISIGANVDSSPVRAFDEEEGDDVNNDNKNANFINHTSNSNGGVTVTATSVGPVVTTVVATSTPQSDIEMKQMAATSSNTGRLLPPDEANTTAAVDATAANVSTKPVMTQAAADLFRMNVILTSFIIGSVIIHIGWVILKFGNFAFGEQYLKSYQDYTRCIFRNWDYVSDSSFERVCGYHPSNRPDVSSIHFYCLCLFGNMLVMGPIYIIASCIAYYHTKDVKRSKKTNQATETF